MRKKAANNLTTKEHFEYFERRVHHWAKVLGLSDWRVVVKHERTGPKTHATANAQLQARVATICLSPSWSHEPVTDQELDRVALHEAAEVLLWQLSLMALRHAHHSNVVDEEVHVIIRRLERALWGNDG